MVDLDDIAINQLDEDMKKKNYQKSISLEPAFSFSLVKKVIEIDYVNIDSLTFKYYLIDPEVMFSNSPFTTSEFDHISYVSPAFEMTNYLD